MGVTASRIVEITDEDESLVIAFVAVYQSAATATMIMITMNNKQQG